MGQTQAVSSSGVWKKPGVETAARNATMKTRILPRIISLHCSAAESPPSRLGLANGRNSVAGRVRLQSSRMGGTMISRLIPAAIVSSATLFGAANDCDRACLKSTLDQYMNAVVKHDPAAAPLLVGFRQTENAVVVR